ncbi:hypothetical protein UlMin_032385 [Ulmus minor]
MKSIFASLALLSLLLLASTSYARKDVGDYWKNIMKDQPIPEAIKDLFHEDEPSLPSSSKTDRFVKDFDIRPNLIIYHSHSEPKEENKSSVLEFEPEHHQEQVIHG